MNDPTSDPSSPPPIAGAPRLRRRANDRVVGGVASGLADYLNVDPLLIRVGLVGLVLFNGAGFFIYLAAWLLIPLEGNDTSIVEGWIRRPPGDVATGSVALLFVGVLATLVFLNAVDNVGAETGVGAWFGLALLVIAAGIVLFRRSPAAGSATAMDRPIGADAPTSALAEPSVQPRPRVARERSPLGLYVVGVLLVVVGALATLDVGTATTVLPREYAGVALGVIGLGLVVGAWLGRARWLIVLGLLLVPPALALSFVRVPLDGEWADRRVVPVSAAELRTEYAQSGGRLTIDLSDLPPSSAERHIAARIGIGRLLVILPADRRADVSAEVGVGASDVLGNRQEGSGLADRAFNDGAGGGFVLDLEAGLGEVRVRTASPGE